MKEEDSQWRKITGQGRGDFRDSASGDNLRLGQNCGLAVLWIWWRKSRRKLTFQEKFTPIENVLTGKIFNRWEFLRVKGACGNRNW